MDGENIEATLNLTKCTEKASSISPMAKGSKAILKMA